MNTISDFNRRAAAWLADGPTELNDRVLEAALREVHLTRQRRRSAAPWRAAWSMRRGLVAAVAVLVIAIGGALLAGAPRTPPIPSPTATAAPTASPSTSSTGFPPVSFTSPLYGYTVSRPGRWVSPEIATVPWPEGGVADTTHPEWFDVFVFSPAAQDIGYAGVAAQPIPDGMTADGWMRAFAERQAASSFACKGPVADWVDASVGTLVARRIDITCNGDINGEDFTGWHFTDVVFVVDGTGYLFNGGPEGVDLLLDSFEPG